jgi:hypothetical protein
MSRELEKSEEDRADTEWQRNCEEEGNTTDVLPPDDSIFEDIEHVEFLQVVSNELSSTSTARLLTHAACVASTSFVSQAAMTPTSLDALAALLSLKSSPFSFALKHCAASLAVLFAQEETLKSVQYCRTVKFA